METRWLLRFLFLGLLVALAVQLTSAEGADAETDAEAEAGAETETGGAGAEAETEAEAEAGAETETGGPGAAEGEGGADAEAAANTTAATAEAEGDGGAVVEEAANTTATAAEDEETANVTATEAEGPTTTTPRPPPSKTLRVTTLLTAPYLMKGNASGEGNDKYRGFIKDLLDAVMYKLNYDYTIQIVADGRFGTQEGEEWTGVIGEVKRGEADMAAGPITITLLRERAVDFSIAFQEFTGSALIKKRSPDDDPITSVQDLLEAEYQFGVAKGGFIARTLEKAAEDDETYKKVWDNIMGYEIQGMKENMYDGIDKARKDPNYAFLLEETTADWILGKEPCNTLDKIPAGIIKRMYGFAVPNQSELRDEINEALMELQYERKIKQMKEKYFGPGACGQNGSTQITTTSLLYVFSMLAAIFVSRRC